MDQTTGFPFTLNDDLTDFDTTRSMLGQWLAESGIILTPISKGNGDPIQPAIHKTIRNFGWDVITRDGYIQEFADKSDGERLAEVAAEPDTDL